MWSRVFYDDFERANGAVGNSWTTTGADGSTGIMSGDLFSTHSGGAGNEVRRYRHAVTPGSDRAIEATLSSFGYRVLLVLADGAVGTYYAEYSAGAVRLYRFMSSTETTIAQVSYTASLGDVMRVEKRGSLFTVFINGTQVLTGSDTAFTADSSYTSGVTFWTQAGQTGSVDDFAAFEWVEPSTIGATTQSSAMVYGFDGSLQPVAYLREYEACVVTRSLFEPSTIDLRLHGYENIESVRYLTFGADDELFRVEQVTLDNGRQVTVHGRSAVCDLEARTIPTAINGTGSSGALIAAILASLTSTRATILTAGDLSHGTTASRQVIGGDALTTIRDLAVADNLGFRCRLAGSAAYLDLIVPAASDVVLGDSLRNVGQSVYQTDTAPWRNFAYVNGEYSGSAVQTTYDATGGSERRELWVDATVDATGLTLPQYTAKLAEEGAKALSDTRKVEWVSASTDVAIGLGDVVWYDGGAWAGYLMCSEYTVAYENGEKRTATLGEVPPDIKQAIRKATR